MEAARPKRLLPQSAMLDKTSPGGMHHEGTARPDILAFPIMVAHGGSRSA